MACCIEKIKAKFSSFVCLHKVSSSSSAAQHAGSLPVTANLAVQSGEAVQILHSGGNHWVTTSTVGVAHPNVRIYDSLQTVLPDNTKQQIAALMLTEDKEIILQYANVQAS